jgi:glycerophosphoryl diester phosphodiesterase
VIVWTPNRPEDWKRLVELGVDGLCTDRPDSFNEWLPRRAPH